MRSRSPRQGFFLLVLAGVVALRAALGQAQVTSITSSGLGTTVSQAGTTWNINGGTRVGSNLFQSFGLFNVGAGDTANFNNTSGLATTNILGRVTDGQPSSIFGRIQTAANFGAANLFLINPAGWLFGPTATLNVGGSFHASTANYVSFPDLADGTKVRFVADNSPLPASGLVANPTAFGFLGPNFAEITVQGSRLAVNAGKTLSLVGGNIQIIGPAGNAAQGPVTATLGAQSSVAAGPGRVQLASVASPGEVSLSPNLEVSSPQLGQIGMSNSARIDVSGNPGGTVVIRGGQLIASQSSQIITATTGSTNGATTAVDIQVSGDMTLAGTSTIETRTTGLGAAGDIFVDVGTLSLTGGSSINTNTGLLPFFIGGPGGDVTVTAKGSISISDPNSRIRSSTDSSGLGGKITISAPSGSLALANAGRVESNSSRSAAGGDIAIDVGSLSIASGGNITSLTGNAAGGNVMVKVADSATISGIGNSIFSRGTAGLSSLPPAGSISLEAGTLSLSGGARIQSGDLGARNGPITVTATDSIVISNNSGISSQTFSQNAAPVAISAPSLTIDQGFVSTSTVGGGNAGPVNVGTPDSPIGTLTLANGGQITSSSEGTSPGDGGNLTVYATGPVSISGRSPNGLPVSPFSNDASSGLFSVASKNTNLADPGNAGQISVTTPTLTIGDGGKISVATPGLGSGGKVLLNVGNLTLTGGARVDSSTTGGGQGGDLTVTAANSASIVDPGTGLFSTASSTGNAGQITVSTTTLAMGNDSTISVATSGAGNAGNTLLNVTNLSLTGGAQVVSGTDGAGQGGSVTVNAANSMSISGSGGSPSGLFSTASSTGNAGQITVSTPTLAMGDGGTISVATSGAGNAGNIALNVSNFTQTGGARVDSSTSGSGAGGDLVVTAANSASISGSGTGLFSTASSTGPGGDIKVQTPRVQILDGATISANSIGTETATAGNVNIVTSDLNLQNGSITTEATLADGGNISITTTGSMVHLTDSQITTSVHSGVGSGGNITINSDLVVLEDSQILANAFGGPGGNITITADVFLVNSGGMLPLSLEGIVDASSALSTPGTVNIEATFTNVTGSVTLLPETPLKATELLRAACAARFAGGKTSSLVVGGRDGIPLQPGDLSPSPLYLAGDADTPSTGNKVTGQEPLTRFSLLGSRDRLLDRYSLLPNAKCAL
jgi:filamentous hemagglutinin family protein